jgi:phosphopantetheinyl transferase
MEIDMAQSAALSFCDPAQFSSFANEEFWMKAFPQKLKDRIGQYKNFADRRMRIMSKWMYFFLYARMSHSKVNMSDINMMESDFFRAAKLFFHGFDYQATGQPFHHESNLKFCASHNENLVVSMCSENAIGIDSESTTTAIREELMNLLHADEYNFWKANGGSQELALSLWTMKEAASKALGIGMLRDWNDWSCLDLASPGLNKKWIYQSILIVPTQRLTICYEKI